MFTRKNTRELSAVELETLNEAASHLLQDGIPEEDVHYIICRAWREGNTLPQLLTTTGEIYKGYPIDTTT